MPTTVVLERCRSKGFAFTVTGWPVYTLAELLAFCGLITGYWNGFLLLARYWAAGIGYVWVMR